MVPRDLKYTQEHEWVRIEGAAAVVGITDHAQRALGDITYVDLPRVGTQVRQNESLSVIESVKAASDLFAPVDGTVAAVNDTLNHAPDIINRSPYGDGWICRLNPFDRSGHAALLTPDEYEKLVAGNK